MATRPLPSIPQKLIDTLELRFPNKLPTKTLPSAEMSELIGQQQIIRLLRQEYERQNNPKEIR